MHINTIWSHLRQMNSVRVWKECKKMGFKKAHTRIHTKQNVSSSNITSFCKFANEFHIRDTDTCRNCAETEARTKQMDLYKSVAWHTKKTEYNVRCFHANANFSHVYRVLSFRRFRYCVHLHQCAYTSQSVWADINVPDTSALLHSSVDSSFQKKNRTLKLQMHDCLNSDGKIEGKKFKHSLTHSLTRTALKSKEQASKQDSKIK